MKKLTYKDTLISCYLGYVTQAIVVNFMPILFVIFQKDYGISHTELGRLILLNFVVQMIVDFVGTKYVDKIGYKNSAIPAHIFCAVGFIMLGTLPNILPIPYIGIALSVVVFAFGGGLIEVVISPMVDAMPSDDSSAAMSFLHSFYCWGQLLVVLFTTLALKVFGYGSWQALAIVWAIIPLYNIYRFIRVPVPETLKEERQPLGELLKTKTFLLGLVLMFGAGAAEQVMAQWASLFAQKGLMVSKVMGDLLGPCLFALLMAIGRTWYGIKGERAGLNKILVFLTILCILCYIAATFAKNVLISLTACALTGFSVSVMWPGAMSYTSAKFPMGGAAMFGVMAICGDLGCSVGPWLAGAASDFSQKLPKVISVAQSTGMGIEQIGLKIGIFTGIIFPVLMLFALAIVNKKKRER